MTAQVQVLRPQRVREQALQSRPMQAEERRAERVPVPLGPARGRDPVAVAAIAMDEPGGLGRYLRQGFAQAQVLQHARRVGRKTDGSAYLAQLGGLFQDLGDDAPPPQQQRQRKSADPGSDDHDRRVTGHRASSHGYRERWL